jgi:parallel beta-helix repeat protein
MIGGTARSAETLAIPISSTTPAVFTKSSWAVELTYTPKIDQTTARMLWKTYIDANNYYLLQINTSKYINLTVVSGGTSYTITGSTAVAVDSAYSIMACGDGNFMTLAVNGQRIGSELAYTEPVGSLLSFMYVGSDQSGASQCNGLIEDVRFSAAERSVEAHYKAYNDNVALPVDELTTLKMDFDNTLRQTTRKHTIRSLGTFTIADNDTTQDKSIATHIVPTGWTTAQIIFNQAIDELPADGGKIVVVDGTFIITGSILCSSNLGIEMTTGTRIKLKDNHPTETSLFKNSDTINGNNNIKISGGIIDSNGQTAAGFSEAIEFVEVTDSIIKDVVAEGTTGSSSITFDTCDSVKVANVHCYGNLSLTSSVHCTITGSSFAEGPNSSYGIFLSGSDYNAISSNDCSNCNEGISIYGSDNNTINGNTCYNNLVNGIVIANSSTKNTVNSNNFQDTGRHGIYLSNQSNNNIVSSNTIDGSGRTTNNTYDCIHVDSNCDYNNIQGNTCRKGTYTNLPRYGVRINSSDCDGNIITNNDLYDSGATANLSDAGTGTVTTAGNRVA